jgi:undecaprenyl-diphosphatase
MIDTGLFYFINGFAGKYAWLDAFAIFLAKYLPYCLVAVLFVFLIKDWKKYRFMIIEASGSALFGGIFVEIIRFLHPRIRPLFYQGVNDLISHSASSAFPSGHATIFFAISTVVYINNKTAGIWFFIASFLMAIARVFTGLHWPLDIAAGMIVGVLSGLVVHKMLTVWLKKDKINA